MTDTPDRSPAPMPPGTPPFQAIADLVAQHAQERPDRPALIQGERRMTWGELNAWVDRVAAGLQAQGCRSGEAIAICAANSIEYVAVFLGALRAGVVVSPLSTHAAPAQLEAMVQDCAARLFFVDGAQPALQTAAPQIRLDALSEWMPGPGVRPQPASPQPADPFNIIYSSGTTGTPKGIVQSHGMRWLHVARANTYGYSESGVTLIATSLCSNTTLVCFFPTVAKGGCVVLAPPRFDARRYLELAQAHRATHTMLVPVQYMRIMAVPDFDRFDLSAFHMKFCTSAPFSAALKADVLKRWPGGLVEFYGMTEGGGTCILDAHLHPDKLHTVGRPSEGHDIRLIDEDGREVAAGEVGEVVGRSAAMMLHYHGQPAKTRDAEWYDAAGQRFIRTGDVGRFDAEGFLTLMDRRKDMIISGGFNIYPSDLETVLRAHPAVAEVAVVGVPSAEWGESPVACVVRRPDHADTADTLRAWANERLGKTQRLMAVHLVDELPRSEIGKVLKRELRERLSTA